METFEMFEVLEVVDIMQIGFEPFMDLSVLSLTCSHISYFFTC